jgi:uncharacterized protein YheU (UPF0270 family)
MTDPLGHLPEHVVIVPHRELSREALMGVIEQFVTRDGPDPGHTDTPLDRKIERVLESLDRGSAVLVFDASLNSCNILPREDLFKKWNSKSSK